MARQGRSRPLQAQILHPSVAAPSRTGQPKIWTGSTFANKPAKIWTGSAWTPKPVKVWDGSQWTLAK